MIKLTDVRKTHFNNKVSTVEALKGVSLELPDNGFVLISGGNGSGKSTLLSILGGLDTISGGKFIVDGKDLSFCKQSMLDDWRARDIAFVFQEYNLLSNYTVAENIRMSAAMSGKKCEDKEIAELLDKVLLPGSEERYPNDLSGGERQKVAVARALIKTPRVIFVDEPTAQADEESTRNLFEILKEISKTILVVCVSHKNNIIKQYTDRVIELKDGLVVKDTTTKEPNSETNVEINKTTSKVPTKVMLGVGMRNFKNYFGKTLISTIITTLALMFFTVSMMLSGYNKFDALSGNAHEKYTYYGFTGEYITQELDTNIKDREFLRYIEYGEDNISGIIEAAEVSNIEGEMLYDNNGDILADGNVVITDYIAMQITPQGNTMADLIGKNLTLHGTNYIISGIVETDCQEYMYAEAGTSQAKTKEYKMENEYQVVFVKTGFANRYVNTTTELNDVDFTITGKGSFNGTVRKYQALPMYDGIGETLEEPARPIETNEVYVSKALYDEISSTTIELRIANGIKKTYTVKATFDLVGMQVMLNDADFETNKDNALTTVEFPTIKIITSGKGITKEQLAELIQDVEKETNLTFVTAYSEEINEFSSKIETFTTLFLIFALFSLVLAALSLYSYISGLIKDKRKDVGILRSMGAKSRTIFGIFATTVGVAAAITFILSTILYFVLIPVINEIASSNISFVVTFAAFNILHILAILGMCIFMSAIATLPTILNYSKQSPAKQLK